MKKLILSMLVVILCSGAISVSAQQTYFVDGFHGGVYGHYPKGYTRFIVEQLQQYPEWKINLEIEPETWDVVKVQEPFFYNYLADMIADTLSRIEYVNPSYAQSYLFNTSAESIIRQFSMGLDKLHEHFPSLKFYSYSCEEPCFTAALPAILRSFGVNYASSKNPNTCWGGYTAGFGTQDFVNWEAADGSRVLCVPRYASEKLEKNSTWQTNAWGHSVEYVDDALQSGVRHPVGMCLQDAGWKGGPWLKMSGHYMPVQFTLWHDYFDMYKDSCRPEIWKMSQEDIKVGLVWGAQVLQKLARQVRVSENLLPQAEKIATLGWLWGKMDWPSRQLKEGWRGLLLAQHHDCWIVPYNGAKGDTWADKVTDWTTTSDRYCNSIITRSATALQAGDTEGKTGVVVFNTTVYDRKEYVTVRLPDKEDPLVFYAEVPAMGYRVYALEQIEQPVAEERNMLVVKGNKYILQSDKYRLVIDPAKGGTIESLQVKSLGNKEFVNRNSEYRFNGLRGYFTEAKRVVDSSELPATVSVLENTPYNVKIKICGEIAGQPYFQTLALDKEGDRIECELQIDWKENIRIGKPAEGKFAPEDPLKSFYNDRYKLHLQFPSVADGGMLYKDAPLDVCKSELENTFFDSWNEIKHNVILHWVDNVDKKGRYGLALLSDHTTSYLQGADYPLGLTVQYSGIGLWGRNYTLEEPTVIRYALIPHAGDWQQAEIAGQSVEWNEPLRAVVTDIRDSAPFSASLLQLDKKGYEVMALYSRSGDVYIRICKTASGRANALLTVGIPFDKAEWVELDGRSKPATLRNGKVVVEMPRFGFKTLKLHLYKK